MRNRALGRALAAVVVATFCAAAQAQNFPTKPITIVFSTAPGGSLDIMSRVAANHFEKKWGQPVVVEPRPGGVGIVALTQVVRAPADGHTLALSGSPMTTTLFVKDVPYDGFKDVTGVSLIGLLAYQLQVSRGANARNLKEFIAYARANPGKVTLGAVAPGSHELEVRSLEQVLGFSGNLIPYKGIAPIWMALIADQVNATMSASTPPQQKTGEILAIAVGGEKRNPAYPDVPTFREQGIMYDPVASYYVLTHGATPRPVLDRISAELTMVAKSADFEARVTRTISIVGVGASVDGTNQFMRREYERLKKVADIAKITPQ